jgi:hypothetical protein
MRSEKSRASELFSEAREWREQIPVEMDMMFSEGAQTAKGPARFAGPSLFDKPDYQRR